MIVKFRQDKLNLYFDARRGVSRKFRDLLLNVAHLTHNSIPQIIRFHGFGADDHILAPPVEHQSKG